MRLIFFIEFVLPVFGQAYDRKFVFVRAVATHNLHVKIKINP